MDFWTATTEEEILQCIKQGWDINSVAEFNMTTAYNTPLEYAVKLQDLKKCKLLIKHGARISRGLLTLASYIGSFEIVVLLVNNGANVNETDANIGTPLESASLNGHTDIYDFLYSHGGFVTHTALFNACSLGKIDIVDRLLRHGVEINKNTVYQPLHACAAKNNTDLINRLILYGVDINSRGFNGTTALMKAVKSSCLAAVSTLIDYGADKTLIDDDQNSAMHYAQTQNIPNPEIIKLVSF